MQSTFICYLCLLKYTFNWHKAGRKVLVIDEVHKYPYWSRELKNIYDGYPDLQVIFSASSALDIYRGESGLSRRVIHYSLTGMSFREYLSFTIEKNFEPVSFDDIISGHRSLASKVVEQFHPLPA